MNLFISGLVVVGTVMVILFLIFAILRTLVLSNKTKMYFHLTPIKKAILEWQPDYDNNCRVLTKTNVDDIIKKPHDAGVIISKSLASVK